MKIKFSPEEITDIVNKHVESLGFTVNKSDLIYQNCKEYEHYGDPTRQDRREIQVKRFQSIEVEAEFKG